MGILRPDVPVNESTPRTFQFGEAYRTRKNIGLDTFGSQSAVQRRCKEFATKCGFQLYVKGNSSKKNNGGNAKYCCKRLNGRQLNDGAKPAQECPCYFNAAGADGNDRARSRESAAKHDSTNSGNCLAGRKEMLPAHDRSTATMTGTVISTFLRSKGLGVSRTAISRIKMQIDYKLHGDRQDSYQKLEAYLRLMAVKNPGSVWRFETYSDGTFMRAGFTPNVGIHISKNARRLFGFDGAHLKGEMNQYGVFLVATAKDFDKSIVPFAFSIAPKENYEHWCWFLNLVKQALCGSKIPLTTEDRGTICKLARSDCENDYNLCKSELLAVNPEAMAYLEDSKNLAPQDWIKYKFTEYYKLPTQVPVYAMHGWFLLNPIHRTNQPGRVHSSLAPSRPTRQSVYLWRLGRLEFPCAHAVKAAIVEGSALGTLYYKELLSLRHYNDRYKFPFKPWPTDVPLSRDETVRVPTVLVEPEEMGSRGKTPGPNKTHKRKRAKNGV
ncbi:hypothetical protein ON010_g17515 [Phytophthora cinnamomi]|nr:hypothetical protein ON010_g17515 [Phytophthora cinnamomi]